MLLLTLTGRWHHSARKVIYMCWATRAGRLPCDVDDDVADVAAACEAVASNAANLGEAQTVFAPGAPGRFWPCRALVRSIVSPSASLDSERSSGQWVTAFIFPCFKACHDSARVPPPSPSPMSTRTGNVKTDSGCERACCSESARTTCSCSASFTLRVCALARSPQDAAGVDGDDIVGWLRAAACCVLCAAFRAVAAVRMANSLDFSAFAGDTCERRMHLTLAHSRFAGGTCERLMHFFSGHSRGGGGGRSCPNAVHSAAACAKQVVGTR